MLPVPMNGEELEVVCKAGFAVYFAEHEVGQIPSANAHDPRADTVPHAFFPINKRYSGIGIWRSVGSE